MQNERYATLVKTRQGRVSSAPQVMDDLETALLETPKQRSYDLEDVGFTISSLLGEEEVYIADAKQDFHILNWVVHSLSKSPMGFNLLEEVVRHGWQVQLDNLDNGGFNLDFDQKLISLDNNGFDAQTLSHAPHYYLALVPVMAKALRDICHEAALNNTNQQLKPESYLQFERIRAADIDTIAIYIGWELRAAGLDDVWRHILAGQDGDMAQVMVNITNRYPTANYDGMALAYVFRQWFIDEDRVDTVDFYTLEHVDLLLENGSNTIGDALLKPQHISLIACMFDGNTYLKDLELVILKDPFFTSMSDPINQSHLFQIIYDSKVTVVNDIPFRDQSLAKKFH